MAQALPMTFKVITGQSPSEYELKQYSKLHSKSVILSEGIRSCLRGDDHGGQEAEAAADVEDEDAEAAASREEQDQHDGDGRKLQNCK